MSATVRALVVENAHAGAPVLRGVPAPEAGPGEALVRLKAAALNHRDVWICKGKYADIRYPSVLGSDGAGVVERVGPGSDASWAGRKVIVNPCLGWGKSPEAPEPGWRILGMPDAGTFSETVKVPVANLAALPDFLSFEEAAALPLAGLTAWRSLFTRGRLKAGERVLVTGVGGGVAQFLLQFALASGARVFATSGSEEKLKRAREAGASGGANYREEGWEKALLGQGGPFDLIVDSAGGPGFSKLLDIVRPGGRLVFFGATAGNPPEMPQRKVFWKQIDLLGSTMGSPQDFAGMMKLVEEKRLRPGVDRVFRWRRGRRRSGGWMPGSSTGRLC
jgi:zinc-binding alcohol dehydrogenase/oxidoreductase